MKRFCALILSLTLLVLFTSCADIPDNPTLPCTHEAGEWEILKEATQTEAGEQIKRCIHCKEILETSSIPVKDTNLMPGAPQEYAITIQNISGTPFKNVSIDIYTDKSLTGLQAQVKTNSSGVAKINLPSGVPYWCVLSSGVPLGYLAQSSYPLSEDGTRITLVPSVIPDPDISGVTYEVGDIIHDFTITDSDGNAFTLSEVLKTKKMVLINFWYIDCYWCKEEFPYMQSVYEEYQDEVAIIAINPYSSDTLSEIQTFKEQRGLTFPMARDTIGLNDAFGEYTWGYPTSVVVDRYGMICFAECNGIVSEEPFRALFDFFTKEDYTPTTLGSIKDLLSTPQEISLSLDIPKKREYKK
jgi:peroxiredoxin